jgi:CRP/FNR family transcriptional regulator, cyclic AMP receptor protein
MENQYRNIRRIRLSFAKARLRTPTATAIDQSLVARIEKGSMITTLHDEPGFSELFMADLLSRNSRIEEDLIDQLFNSSEKRLARALLLLANFGNEATVEPIVGKFSQETFNPAV